MRTVRTIAALVLLAGGLTSCWEGPTGLVQGLEVIAPPGVHAGGAAVIRATAAGWMSSRATFRFSSVDGVVEADGPQAVFRPSASHANAVVQVVMSVDGVPQAHDSVVIAIYEQIVILKADDLTHGRSGDLPEQWRAFLAYARDAGLHVGIGVIGRSLETGSPQYRTAAREIAADARFEIWNHGYDHLLDQVRPDGTRYSEFSGTSLEEQITHLRRTQDLARAVLDVTPRAFGAPGNAIDENTARALAAVPELDIWLYGRPTASKLVLDRRMEIEVPIFEPDYERFVETYLPDVPVLTLQIHPGAWDSQRLAEFGRIIEFLRSREAAFLTPSEYAALAAGQP